MSLNNSFINNTIICNEKKEVDLDALNLLASGEMEELCPCSYKNEKGHHHFVYDTNGLTSFAQLQADISFENAIKVLAFAVKLIEQFADKGLIIDNLKNAKEYIFKSDNGYKFIYIPIIQKSHQRKRDYLLKILSVIHLKDIRITELIKKIKKIKDDEAVITCVTGFIASFNYQDNHPEDATSVLSEEAGTTLLSNEPETSLLSDEGETSLLNTQEDEVGFNNVVQIDPIISYEGETTVLSQSGFDGAEYEMNTDSERITAYFNDESSEYETTVLTSQPQIIRQVTAVKAPSKHFLTLIRNINGENISIDVTPFTIGKDSANVDFVLNNESVSRQHATVMYEDGSYYILDNNSTNGTMIEGIRLQPGEKGEIENGYIISLGNESFQAHIERR